MFLRAMWHDVAAGGRAYRFRPTRRERLMLAEVIVLPAIFVALSHNRVRMRLMKCFPEDGKRRADEFIPASHAAPVLHSPLRTRPARSSTARKVST